MRVESKKPAHGTMAPRNGLVVSARESQSTAKM